MCDITSWPSRERTDLWQEFLQEWNIKEEDMKNFKGNPIDNLKPLAKAKIPIIAVAGDSDKTAVSYTHLDIKYVVSVEIK